ISVKYLEQLASLLVQAAILRSVRGPKGGYVLAQPAADIKVGGILRAAEGTCAPVACLEDDFGVCPRRSECETIAFWEGLDQAIENYVDSVTLANLLVKK
ncbi:MAG: Rrf2 family transcriptional regulator, partial [Raoultibacter sp.]